MDSAYENTIFDEIFENGGGCTTNIILKDTLSNMSTNVSSNIIQNRNEKYNILCPRGFEEFIGQENIKKKIMRELSICKKYDKKFPHSLFIGNPGLGKSTLIELVAVELGKEVCFYLAPINENKLLKIINERLEKDNEKLMMNKEILLVLEEIHLQKEPEILYSLMQDFFVEINGVIIYTPNLIITGATTKAGELEAPFMQRFELVLHLEKYKVEELLKISKINLDKLRTYYNEDVPVAKDSYLERIARMAWGTPRILNNTLKSCFKLALLNKCGICDEIIDYIMKEEKLTGDGCNVLDLRYLKTLKDALNCEPKGLAIISSLMRESKDTLTNIIEPKLLELSLIITTPRGRKITDKGVDYVDKYKTYF